MNSNGFVLFLFCFLMFGCLTQSAALQTGETSTPSTRESAPLPVPPKQLILGRADLGWNDCERAMRRLSDAPLRCSTHADCVVETFYLDCDKFDVLLSSPVIKVAAKGTYASAQRFCGRDANAPDAYMICDEYRSFSLGTRQGGYPICSSEKTCLAKKLPRSCPPEPIAELDLEPPKSYGAYNQAMADCLSDSDPLLTPRRLTQRREYAASLKLLEGVTLYCEGLTKDPPLLDLTKDNCLVEKSLLKARALAGLGRFREAVAVLESIAEYVPGPRIKRLIDDYRQRIQ